MRVLIERENRKTISIRLETEDILLVKAPKGLPTRKIDEIVQEKSDWIRKKRQAIIETKDKYSSLYEFEQILIDGEFFEMNINSNKGSKNYIDFTAKSFLLSRKDFNQDKKKTACLKLIYSDAKQRIPTMVSNIGTKMSLCPSSIEIKKIRGKHVWGKCGLDKKITLDYHIVQLPKDLQVYIIVHEFCHLLHLNHSAEFHKALGFYLSDYKNLAKKLTEYSFIRDIYI